MTEQFKPVALEIYEFGNRQINNINLNNNIFGLSSFQSKEQSLRLFKPTI